MKLIDRDYLHKMIDLIGTPDIKVITGVRRAGKSKLMESFIEYVGGNIKNAKLIYVNLSLIEFEELKEYHRLYNYVSERYEEGKQNFLCIDEVQMCDKFELAINSLHAEERFDIYLTGSNAFLLSSDLATLFTGRCFEIPVFPFSFEEYLKYYEYRDIGPAFDKYFAEGGMPGAYLYVNDEMKLDYIKDVFATIVERDLIKCKKIRNKTLLLKIAYYLMDNIGNLTSTNGIAIALSTGSKKVSDKTVSSHIRSLCETFLFYEVLRYDIRGKKYLQSNAKYYLCDTSFRYGVLGKKDMNYGRSYENMVALDLLRRGYEIYVGVLYKKEIDFVAVKRSEKIYIQVADSIADESTFKREVDPLLKIKDAYQKLLIARTHHSEYIYEGVRVIDIADWLARK